MSKHLPKQAVEDAAERCVQMVCRAMHEPSATARMGYEAAARFFALAAVKDGK
jgi:hypothetical protein